jgi:proton-coupled amino acid transporter
MPEAAAVASQTYVVREDQNRWAKVARYFGLASARQPLGNVRAVAASMLHNNTLESARMHSVGALGQDERVDEHGTLHIMTLTRKPRRQRLLSQAQREGFEKKPPSYSNLEDLVQQPVPPVEPEEGEDDDVQFVVKDTVEGGSLTAATFGIIKGTVGPAILFLPRGFELSGYAVAIPSMLVATASYLYSANRLLECWSVEKTRLERLDEIRELLLVPSSSPGTPVKYGSIGKNTEPTREPTIILTYSELARRAFGNWSFVVRFGIACMQFGVCLTYLIFVPQNLVKCIKSLFNLEVDKLVFLIAMIAIEIPLSWIQDIRKLTPTNILATCLIAYGLASCLAIAFVTIINEPDSNIATRIAELPPINDTWYLFIGTSVSHCKLLAEPCGFTVLPISLI